MAAPLDEFRRAQLINTIGNCVQNIGYRDGWSRARSAHVDGSELTIGEITDALAEMNESITDLAKTIAAVVAVVTNRDIPEI